MKKVMISIIMTVLLLASFTGFTTSQASNSASVSMSGSTVIKGKNASITIAFSEPVKTAGFRLSYDASKLQYVSNSVGSSVQMSGNEGNKIVVFTAGAGNSIRSITFTFKTLSTGKANCTVNKIDLSDKNNEPIDNVTASVSATVTINTKPEENPDNKPNENTNTNGGSNNTNTNTNGGSNNNSNKNNNSNANSNKGNGSSSSGSNNKGNSSSTNKNNQSSSNSKNNNNNIVDNNEKNNQINNEINNEANNETNDGTDEGNAITNTENVTNNSEIENEGKDNKTPLSQAQIVEYSIFGVIGLIIAILIIAVVIREIRQRKNER